MSVESHYFTRNASQNQRNKNTEETADTTKMADSSPQDTTTVMTELKGIKNILMSLAAEVSGVKRGLEAVNETVKSLGCRITEAESRISKLKDEVAKRAPVVKDLERQKHILKEKITALEGFSRRQNIHIAGVKEGMEGRDWDGFMKTLLSETLNINVDDWYEVERIHPGSGRPRQAKTHHCPVSTGQSQGCRVNGGEKEEASHLERHKDFFLSRLGSRDTGKMQKIRGGETNSLQA